MNCLLIILAVIKHPAFGAYFDTTPQLMSRLIDVKEEVRQVEAKYETLYASCSTSMYTSVNHPYRFYSVASNEYTQSKF